jgi:tetratricopeptide (TPR) repeat protein
LHVVVTALVAALGVASPAATQSTDRWIAVRTRHFNIVSNANERDVRRAASGLEQFVAEVSGLLGARIAAGPPVTVTAFRDDRSFRPFKPLYNGQPSSISGFFQRTQDETIIALDINAGRAQQPFAVIFHEYTHRLTADVARAWPAWLVEGLAEFYSTFEADGDQVTLGAPIADHVRLLREGPMLPLAELFAVTPQSATYNEGRRQNIFYAESWALVHYLMLGNNRRNQSDLERFLDAISEGQEAEPAFRETFRMDYQLLETELRGYVSRRVYPVVSYRMEAPVALSGIELRPMTRAEIELQLGNLLLQTDRLAEAEAFFNRARALDPDAPGVYDSLGFLALRRSQPDVAIARFRDAASRDSRNYLAHYTYADTVYRQTRGGRLTADLATIILTAARTAATIEPQFLPAWHLMGRVYLDAATDSDVPAAIGSLTEAQAIFPEDPRIALILGSLQARRRDFAAARSSLAAVTTSRAADDVLKGEARRLLIQIEEALMLEAIRAEPAPR